MNKKQLPSTRGSQVNVLHNFQQWAIFLKEYQKIKNKYGSLQEIRKTAHNKPIEERIEYLKTIHLNYSRPRHCVDDYDGFCKFFSKMQYENNVITEYERCIQGIIKLDQEQKTILPGKP